MTAPKAGRKCGKHVAESVRPPDQLSVPRGRNSRAAVRVQADSVCARSHMGERLIGGGALARAGSLNGGSSAHAQETRERCPRREGAERVPPHQA